MSYGNGIKLTAGFDVGAKTPLDSKSVVQTIAERDAFVTDNLAYEGLEVYVKDTGHKYRYNGTSWIDLDTQSGSESGTGEGLTTEQANQLTTAYEHSQTPHVSADDIPTKTSDLTNDSGFITSSDLPTVPTKVSDLENDRGYLISIPEEYITETELETKGYLTEHQSLTDYAKKTDIPDVSDFLTEVPAGYVTDTKLSTELDKKVNKEVGKGLSTNDLTNELVTKINSSATEAFVTNAIANAQLGSGEVDLSGYATVDALKLKADLTHTHDQYLTKVPDEYITETELTDKNYADKTYVTQAVSNVKVDLTGYAKTSDIPTKTSDLNNDSGFIGHPDVIVINKGSMEAEVDLDNDIPLGYNTILLTGCVVSNTYKCELVFVYRDIDSSDSFTIYTMRGNKVVVNKSNGNWNITSSTSFIYRDNANSLYQKIKDNTLTTTAKTIPTAINELKSGLDGIKVPINISELNNDSGYLTSHQDISNLQPKTDDSLTTTDKTVIGAINEVKLSIPTKVSDLANDKNYISSIPSEYVTETELNAKGYLTSHQDISGLQSKTDNNLTTTSKEVVGAINEVKDMADLILDTEVRIDKTYSSSKIYSAIQDAIDSSKSFTLAEIGKMSGASYKVVTSTTEMTDEKIIYLLKNGATYDMYILETTGTVTKIGDTAIDLSSYLKVTDAESAYLKKTEATSTYVAQTSFNNHITDTVAHLTQLEKNKLLTTDNITSTINNSSDNTQVPTAKATYNLANTKANTNHTHSTSDITDLSIPTKVGDLENDRGYLTSIPEEYITETELKAKGYLTSHQDISGLQTKTDNKLATTSKEVVGAINELDTNKIDKPAVDGTAGQILVLQDDGSLAYEDNVGSDTTGLTNVHKVFCGIDEINNAKGTNISLVAGEDNTEKIMSVLAPNEVFVDWFRNDSGWGRFGINPNLGTRINFLSMQKYNNDNDGIAIAITDKGKVLNRFMRNNNLLNWEYDTTVNDVGVTTITPVNSNITGNIEYTVKNGICYVSMKNLMSTVSSTNLVISNAMPKPSINCTASSSSVSSSGNIATIYIDKNTTTLRGDFYVKDAKSNCSFSYPVAES